MEQKPAAGSRAGNIAGIVAGVLALIVMNALGLGAALGGRFLTGFIVGGGTYFVVSIVVDALTQWNKQ